MNLEDILAHCDHTLLRPDAEGTEIMQLCDEGIRYSVAAVCIPPCHVAGARRYVGDQLKICTVVAFPHGTATPRVKAFEAQEAIRNGADEIDAMINLAMVKDACWDDLLAEMKTIREFTQGHVLKLIVETCLLTEEEKRIVCSLVTEAGADYIKTSTGFAPSGATLEDVALLRACCGEQVKVKASGGIQTLQAAEDFLALGADRLGTSRLVKLAAELEKASLFAPSSPTPVEHSEENKSQASETPTP